MPDWEVKVRTETNYIKTIRVNDCFNRDEAELQARSATGIKDVIISNPVYDNGFQSNDGHYEDQSVKRYEEKEEEDVDDRIDEKYKFLDKLSEMEEEMYDLMCRIALNNGKELPTIQEFYDYIGKE